MCCEARVASTHTLRVSIYSSVGVSLFVLFAIGCGRPEEWNGQMKASTFFVCGHQNSIINLTLGCLSEQKELEDSKEKLTKPY